MHAPIGGYYYHTDVIVEFPLSLASNSVQVLKLYLRPILFEISWNWSTVNSLESSKLTNMKVHNEFVIQTILLFFH